MKTLALFAIFVLFFGTVSASLTNSAYAQNDPDILLRIATQADKQISNQLDRIYDDSVPSDIQTLYQQGHAAVRLLENSLPDDLEQAQESFLVAMKSFKQITRMISEPVEEPGTISNASDRDLTSELDSLDNYFQILKAISEKHNMGIDFSKIKELFVQARQQTSSDDIQEANKTIEKLESLIEAIKNDIYGHESHSTSDRAKKFALKQLDEIQDTLDKAENMDLDISEVQQANSLVQEIQTLIDDDNISDAKEKFGELIELVKIIKSSMS